MPVLARVALAACCLLTAATLPAQSSVVRGRVRDGATSQPLGGALVDLVGESVVERTRTSTDGLFAFRAVPNGAYHVSVHRLGYAPVEYAITVAGEPLTLAVALAPLTQRLADVTVRGTWTGVYGTIGSWPSLEPIAGARVQLVGAGVDVRADSAGLFRVPVKPGSYLVRVSAPQHAEQIFSVVVPRDRGQEVSRLLDVSDVPPNPVHEAMLFDAGRRIQFRGPGSAVLTGDALRATEMRNPMGAIERLPEFQRRNLRFASTVCVFLNGRPAPGYTPDAASLDEIESVEAYVEGARGDALNELAKTWPGKDNCGDTGRGTKTRTNNDVRYLVIWTKR